jgi:hypothetical protein
MSKLFTFFLFVFCWSLWDGIKFLCWPMRCSISYWDWREMNLGIKTVFQEIFWQFEKGNFDSLEKEILGSVKAFQFLLKISPVKISEKNSCPLRDGNHLGQTRPNLRWKLDRYTSGVGKVRRVMSNPHSKIDPNMSGYWNFPYWSCI